MKMVVVEAVFLIPEAGAVERVDGGDDRQVVLKKLADHVFVGGVIDRELHGDREHLGSEVGHPGGAVGLLEVAGDRQRLGAI